MFNIAKKEIHDILKNKLFLGSLILLFVLTFVSVILGSLQVKIQLDSYHSSIAFLQSLGKTNLPSPPNLNPLSSSKDFVNYIGMIGALLAIILGNTSITKEYKAKTMSLILSKQVTRDQFLMGKLMGNAFILFAITLSNLMITLISLVLITGVGLSLDDLLRLILFFSMALLYMLFFTILSMSFAALWKKGSKSLLATIVIWLLLAFVFPQIGDTMDMDNQLPGGFFSAMGLDKSQETQVLSQFTYYETIRDSIEELSPTKHFERISFALLNVKPGFDTNTAIEVVGIKWINLMGLTLPSITIYIVTLLAFLKRETLFQSYEN